MPLQFDFVRGLRLNVAAEPRAPRARRSRLAKSTERRERYRSTRNQDSRSSWTTARYPPRRAPHGASVQVVRNDGSELESDPRPHSRVATTSRRSGTLPCVAFETPDPSRSRALESRSPPTPQPVEARGWTTSRHTRPKTCKVADRNLPKALPVSDAQAVQAPPARIVLYAMNAMPMHDRTTETHRRPGFPSRLQEPGTTPRGGPGNTARPTARASRNHGTVRAGVSRGHTPASRCVRTAIRQADPEKEDAATLAPLHEGVELSFGLGSLRHLAVTTRELRRPDGRRSAHHTGTSSPESRKSIETRM